MDLGIGLPFLKVLKFPAGSLAAHLKWPRCCVPRDIHVGKMHRVRWRNPNLERGFCCFFFMSES